jgi:hypothetical protein
MGDPLSVIASCIAILQLAQTGKGWVVAIYRAEKEQGDYLSLLHRVELLCHTVKKQIEKAAGQNWFAELDPDVNAESPLKMIELTLEEVTEASKAWAPTKSKVERAVIKAKWLFLKKKLDGNFEKIEGYYNEVMIYLQAANITISEDDFALSKEQYAFLKEHSALSITLGRATNDLTRAQYARQGIHFALSEEQLALAKATNDLIQAQYLESFALAKETNNLTKAHYEQSKKKQQEKYRIGISSWLSPISFRDRQQSLYDHALARTIAGRWFLNCEAFQCWKRGDLKYLRCYGDAGAGKASILSFLQGQRAGHGI